MDEENDKIFQLYLNGSWKKSAVTKNGTIGQEEMNIFSGRCTGNGNAYKTKTDEMTIGKENALRE